MKSWKKTWDAWGNAVSYKKMKSNFYIGLFLCLLLSAQVFAQNYKDLMKKSMKQSFSVRSKGSRIASPMEKRKAKAMKLAGKREKARPLSAKFKGMDGDKYIFKVKLMKQGTVFFKAVRVN